MSQHGGSNLSAWTLQRPSLMVFLMLAVTITGAMSYFRLSRNEDPPFTIKTMVVSAQWPGASTRDTVNLVTEKLERKLSETPHLDFTQSYTRPGQAVIFVNLRDDTPAAKVAETWYQVRKKMADVLPLLPEGVQGPFLNDEFGDTFGLIYAFEAEGFNKRELRDRVDQVRAELLAVPDIGKVSVLGAEEEQVVISFSTRKLAALGINPSAALEAIRAQNAVVPGGLVRTAQETIAVRISGALASERSLEDLTFRIDGRFVRLTDIASIARQAADPPAAAVRVNGRPVIALAISMAEGGNLLDFGKAVKAKMSEIAGKLPYGIEMTEVADQSVVVSDAVFGFLKVLAEAIVIVLAVSFISLGTRAGLVITASIPLVLALTFLGMEWTGIGLQRISLGALIIALGLLVDDAMITVETMVACLERGMPRREAASHAYATTAYPMLTGTLVMIAGFIPVGCGIKRRRIHVLAVHGGVDFARRVLDRRGVFFADHRHVAAARTDGAPRSQRGAGDARLSQRAGRCTGAALADAGAIACSARRCWIRRDQARGAVLSLLGPARIAREPDPAPELLTRRDRRRGPKAGGDAEGRSRCEAVHDLCRFGLGALLFAHGPPAR